MELYIPPTTSGTKPLKVTQGPRTLWKDLPSLCTRWLSGKEPTHQCRRGGFDPWVGKIPCRKKWQPTPVFLCGKFHGGRQAGGLQSMGSQRGRHDCPQRTHRRQNPDTPKEKKGGTLPTHLSPGARRRWKHSSPKIPTQISLRCVLFFKGWKSMATPLPRLNVFFFFQER